MQEDHDLAGVLGDGASHPGKANLALVRRAIRADWPIPAEVRSRLVNQMAKILGNEDTSDAMTRTVIAAAKVLVAADSVNVRREALDVQAERHPPEGVEGVRTMVLRIPDSGRGPTIQEQLQAIDGTEPEYLEWRSKMALKKLGYDNPDDNPYKAAVIGRELS